LRRFGSSRDVEELIERLPVPVALIIADELRSALEERVGVAKEATYTVSFRSRVVETEFTLLDVRGRGRVREAVLLADSPDFDVYVEVDGRSIFSHSFAELQSISEVMEGVDAFDRDGEYVFRFSDLSFLNRFLYVIRPRGRVTLKHALVLYNLA
jgi:hypothetical protein